MSVGPRREPSGSERAGLAGPPRRDLRPHPRSCEGASDLSVFCSVTRLRRPRALGCEAPFVWPAPFPQRIPFASPLAVPGKEKAGHTHLRPRLAPLGRAWGRPRRWALVRLRAFRTSAWRPPCRRPGLSHQAAHAGSRVCVHRRWLRAALHAQGHTRHAPCPCGGHWPRAPVPPYGPEVRAQSGPHGGRTKRPGLAPAGGLRGALPAPPSRARPPARPVPSPPRDAPTTPGTGSVSGRRTRRLSSFGGFSSPLLGNVTATGPRV